MKIFCFLLNYVDDWYTLSRVRFIDILAGCTILSQVGDGKRRGTCEENFLCHADGICKPKHTPNTPNQNTKICSVQGSKGDGINRGSCNEGRICFSDGSCKVPGLKLW